MEFGCSICEYTSPKKANIITHFKNKRSCGIGIKEVVEIPIEINCEYCNKKFATRQNLNEHIKNNCKHKDDAKDEEIKRLKEELNKANAKAKNITINDHSTNYIIVVNNYENTSLEKLTDKIYNKIIRDIEEPYKMIPNLIKQIHFNPNTPENHNIYLSNRNKNNKHLQIYRNHNWEITDKETEIDNLISDKETMLGDWIAEKGENYSEAVEKYNEYIEQKYDDDTIKLIKEEVELALYNGRNMIKRRN